MNQEELKEHLTQAMFHASTVKLLTEDKQVLEAVKRVENLISKIWELEINQSEKVGA